MLELKGLLIVVSVFAILSFELINRKQLLITIKTGNSTEISAQLGYIVIILLFWLFAVCVTDSHDLYYYQYAYENGIGHGKEPFFDLVTRVTYDWGWSFGKFKLIWVSIITILLFCGIKKYGKSNTLTAALFLVTPAGLYVTGMRSSMAGAIILNAIPLLMTNRKKDKVIYIIIVLLCAQIHISSYAYLLFLLVEFMKDISKWRFSYYIVLLASASSLIFSTYMDSSIGKLFERLLLLVNEDASLRISSYFGGGGNHLRYELFLILKHLFLYFLTNKACEIKLSDKSISENDVHKYSDILKINILLLFFLPITILSASFERFFSYFLLVQYAVIFDVSLSSDFNTMKTPWKRILKPVLCFGIVLFTFIEIYFSPGDIIRLLNSVEWVFGNL